mgnify:CR=1 FL=1
MRWTLAFATLALAATVQAGENPAPPPAGRNSVDANADGIVTREEAQAHPRLAGQYADYLAKSLRDYQTGSRKNAIMAGFAATLSEQDIADLAAFYASQPGALEDLSHLE